MKGRKRPKRAWVCPEVSVSFCVCASVRLYVCACGCAFGLCACVARQERLRATAPPGIGWPTAPQPVRTGKVAPASIPEVNVGCVRVRLGGGGAYSSGVCARGAGPKSGAGVARNGWERAHVRASPFCQASARVPGGAADFIVAGPVWPSSAGQTLWIRPASLPGLEQEAPVLARQSGRPPLPGVLAGSLVRRPTKQIYIQDTDFPEVNGYYAPLKKSSASVMQARLLSQVAPASAIGRRASSVAGMELQVLGASGLGHLPGSSPQGVHRRGASPLARRNSAEAQLQHVLPTAGSHKRSGAPRARARARAGHPNTGCPQEMSTRGGRSRTARRIWYSMEPGPRTAPRDSDACAGGVVRRVAFSRRPPPQQKKKEQASPNSYKPQSPKL